MVRDTKPLTGNYFVSNYPPFSSWQEKETSAWVDMLQHAVSEPPNLLLYVHIPFCVERCQYCYYLSYDDRPQQMKRYTQALIAELSRYAGTPALSNRRPIAVYFGGGTPSLLPVPTLRSLLVDIKPHMPWDAAQEITFECAPKSVTRARMELLKEQGVSRISMGVQQLNDSVLQRNGRTHLTADVSKAYDVIQETGFEVVNIDLMVGLLGETDDSFLTSLRQIISMEPESITVYQMEIPFNTPLYHALQSGNITEPPAEWEVKRDRLNRGIDILESSGYSMRSAYTAVRDSCPSSFVYQDEQYRGADLLGIGASSFSSLSGIHLQNLPSLNAYMKSVENGNLPLSRAHVLTEEDKIVREFVLQLKIGRVDCNYFRSKFDVDPRIQFAPCLKRLEEEDLLSLNNGEIRLTRKGLLCADHLLLEFYLPEHQGLRYS